jgi:hypothetical protein
MARICPRRRQSVARGDDHVCLDDDDATGPAEPQDGSDEDGAA